MGDAGASHCIYPGLPRGANATAQLNRVKSERSTSGINSAAAYAHTNRDCSAMATRSHGDRAPVFRRTGPHLRAELNRLQRQPIQRTRRFDYQSYEPSYGCCVHNLRNAPRLARPEITEEEGSRGGTKPVMLFAVVAAALTPLFILIGTGHITGLKVASLPQRSTETPTKTAP